METGRDIGAFVADGAVAAGIGAIAERGVGAAIAVRIGGTARGQVLTGSAAGIGAESGSGIVALAT